MEYLLARKQYDRLFLDVGYPKNSAAAKSELRSRGFDIQGQHLDALIRLEKIENPAGSERNRRWHKEDVDAAFEVLSSEGAPLIPTAAMCLVENLSLAQLIDAEREATERWPLESTDTLVLEILPGAPGVGIAAQASYRAMTDGERTALEDLIARKQKRSK